MEEIYVNVDRDKSVQSRPSGETGPRRSERRFHGAVVLGLGLLVVSLLAVLIGLGVHHMAKVHGLATQLSVIKANLTECLLASEELSTRKKRCPAGWRMFNRSCYLLSTESAPWDKGKEDCTASGADLLVIDSPEEQTFISVITTKSTWIGLNDREEEGIWKWVDESPLTLKYWGNNQPDNGNDDPQWGEEDCVHIKTYEDNNWNDLSCNASLQWICEKVPDIAV